MLAVQSSKDGKDDDENNSNNDNNRNVGHRLPTDAVAGCRWAIALIARRNCRSGSCSRLPSWRASDRSRTSRPVSGMGRGGDGMGRRVVSV